MWWSWETILVVIVLFTVMYGMNCNDHAVHRFKIWFNFTCIAVCGVVPSNLCILHQYITWWTSNVVTITTVVCSPLVVVSPRRCINRGAVCGGRGRCQPCMHRSNGGWPGAVWRVWRCAAFETGNDIHCKVSSDRHFLLLVRVLLVVHNTLIHTAADLEE